MLLLMLNLLVVSKDVDGSESKANDVDYVVKDKIFVSGEDVDSNVKKVDIKDDDGNVVVSDEKLFNGDEDVVISQQNYVVTGDKMLVSDEELSEAKRSDMGDVDMVHVSDENMSVFDDGVKVDFVVVPNLKLMAKEIQLLENEMIEVVSVKETIIISDDAVTPYYSLNQENVQDLHLIPHQLVIEEDQLDLKVIPIKDHSVSSDTLERLNYYKAAQLNNSGRHPSPVYARFISLILEKALGNNYVIYEEIALRIPLMGNSIFNLEPTSSEVLITCHMDRVCKSVFEACLVSEDVAGLNLYDNVYDGSSSEDPKFNEIIQNVKTKTMSSLLDPNSIATTDVYQYKVVTNVLNEDVIGESAIPSGSCDHNLKDDCYGKANEISDCLNEEVIDQSAIYSGSGNQNLKDNCPGKTIDISNCLSEAVIDQSEIPSSSGDHNLKDDCFGKQVSPSQSIKNLIHGGDDIMNVDFDDESENEGNHRAFKDVVQSYSNLSEFNGLTEQVRLLTNQVTSLVNEQQKLKDQINKLHTSSTPSTKSFVVEVVKGVTPALSSVLVEINGLTIVQKDLKDEINELKKSSSSKSSIDQVTRDVISAIQLELKSIKEHISSCQIPSFPSKESLVVEFVKCIEASNSSLSKDVTKLSAKQKELVDEVNKLGNSSLSNPSIDEISKVVVGLIKLELESFIKSVTNSFLKTKVNINVPKDILWVGESMRKLSNSVLTILSIVNTITQRPVQLSPEFETLPGEIQRFRSSVNDIVTFKAVDDFENHLVESVPSKKERLTDQQLMEVILINQALIKANISKISDSMLLLVKWAKRIFVDGRIPLVKVRWNSKRGPEFTWEREDQFEKKYPHLFTKTASSSSAASSGDQNLKDNSPDKTIDISNCLREEVIDQSAIPSGSDDHNLKVDCHVNSNEVSNMQNHVESDNQLQSESNVYAFMLSKQVSPGQSIENLIHRGDDIMNVDCDDESENKGNHCTFEDVVHAYLNLSEFNGLTEQVRLLTNQVTSLVNEHIKEHISSIQIPSFPSKESLVAEFVKCIEANNSSLSKDVTELSAKQKELVDEIPVELSPQFATLHEEIQRFRPSECLLHFKVVMSNLAKNNYEEKGLEYDNEPSFAEIQATILNVGYTKVGSGDQNIKDDCLDKTIKISNCLSEEVVYQSAIPSGSGDHNLKEYCFGKVNEVSNCLNQEVIVETIIPTGSDDHNLKVDCHVNSNEVSNMQNHVESDNQLQSESNVYAFMLSKQVSPESLVAEFVKCIEANNSSLSKDVTELSAKQKELVDERFRSSVNDIVTFKVEISNLAKNNHENVSMFKHLSVYFSNLQKAVNDFENHLVECVPSKKERLADEQLMEVISINQALIKANISKISDSMLLLVKWAKRIFVDGSASVSKTTPGSKYNEETKLISLTTKKCSFEIEFGVAAFWSICGFNYLEKGLEYDNEPSFAEIQATILNVGYTKVETVDGLHQLWGVIFNDLAAKLNNSGRHPSPVYARFISLILEKALGNNYVIYEEIALRIPLMGNSIFNLEPTSSEVLITCHMDRVCKSISEACLVYEDVAGLNLCDNVYDGSSSKDPKFNEIIQNVKSKTMSSLLDPNSIATIDVYQYKVVTNVLNEDVIGESAIPSGHFNILILQHLFSICDHNLKDDCYGRANEISNCLNEEVIDQSSIYSGSGDHNLKEYCFGKVNEVSNCLNQEVIVETIIPTGSDDHNLKVDCHVNSNEVSNMQNHVESDNQLQSESNVYAFMLSKQVSPVNTITQIPVELSPEFATLHEEIQRFRSSVNDIVTFKVEISNLAKNNHENNSSNQFLNVVIQKYGKPVTPLEQTLFEKGSLNLETVDA
ncbi:hypothetical protein Tco_1507408 [Tanacetum coccineum]